MNVHRTDPKKRPWVLAKVVWWGAVYGVAISLNLRWSAFGHEPANWPLISGATGVVVAAAWAFTAFRSTLKHFREFQVEVRADGFFLRFASKPIFVSADSILALELGRDGLRVQCEPEPCLVPSFLAGFEELCAEFSRRAAKPITTDQSIGGWPWVVIWGACALAPDGVVASGASIVTLLCGSFLLLIYAAQRASLLTRLGWIVTAVFFLLTPAARLWQAWF